MYSGLLPKGLTEEDLSSEEEVEEKEEGEESQSNAEKLSCAAGNNEESQPPSDSPTCSSMPGISQDMWQKFQDLRAKNEELKRMKVPIKRKRRRKHKKGTEREKPAEISERQEEREKHWDELKQYFGVNDRFHPPPCSTSLSKQSGLEKSIEGAIAEGDVEKAEEMSDRLATRELALTISDAAQCRDFVKRKQEEEAVRAAQKRRRDIPWGFQAKKRWETKSNMGFM